MQDTTLYAEILKVRRPWRVDRVDLDDEAGEVHVHMECRTDARLVCPDCGQACPGYDTKKRRWRHLDTCEYRTIVFAQVPRVQCPEHGVKQVSVPWSEPNARFTASFEARVIGWLEDASITAVAKRMGLGWHATSGIMQRAVDRGIARRDAMAPRRIGVDETSAKKRHNYVTIIRDIDRDLVLDVTDGRGKESLASFYRSLSEDRLKSIEAIVMDMHGPYISATEEHIPDAEKKINFDKFHVASHLGEAVDKVRREENRELMAEEDQRLKGTRFLWLWNPQNMPAARWRGFKRLRESVLRTARAWAIREEAMMLWHYVSPTWARKAWKKWLGWAMRSRLEPIKKVGRMVKRHLYGIINAVVSGLTNAGSEAMNGKIQHVKRMARGLRNPKRFRAAILFHCGRLDLYPDAARP